jgi:hypothetical protein
LSFFYDPSQDELASEAVALHKDGQVDRARKLIEDLTRQVPRLTLGKVL